MRLKKSKDEVLENIKATVRTSISNNLEMTFSESYNYSNLNKPYKDILMEAFSSSIAKAIEEAFRTYFDSEYTDEDFEKDIGLVP